MLFIIFECDIWCGGGGGVLFLGICLCGDCWELGWWIGVFLVDSFFIICGLLENFFFLGILCGWCFWWCFGGIDVVLNEFFGEWFWGIWLGGICLDIFGWLLCFWIGGFVLFFFCLNWGLWVCGKGVFGLNGGILWGDKLLGWLKGCFCGKCGEFFFIEGFRKCGLGWGKFFVCVVLCVLGGWELMWLCFGLSLVLFLDLGGIFIGFLIGFFLEKLMMIFF